MTIHHAWIDARIREARQGDLAAFGEVVEHLQGVIRGYACMAGAPASEAEELAQRAFVEAFTNLAAFDPAQPFLPWLRGITRHVVLRWIDREAVEARYRGRRCGACWRERSRRRRSMAARSALRPRAAAALRGPAQGRRAQPDRAELFRRARHASDGQAARQHAGRDSGWRCRARGRRCGSASRRSCARPGPVHEPLCAAGRGLPRRHAQRGRRGPAGRLPARLAEGARPPAGDGSDRRRPARVRAAARAGGGDARSRGSAHPRARQGSRFPAQADQADRRPPSPRARVGRGGRHPGRGVPGAGAGAGCQCGTRTPMPSRTCSARRARACASCAPTAPPTTARRCAPATAWKARAAPPRWCSTTAPGSPWTATSWRRSSAASAGRAMVAAS